MDDDDRSNEPSAEMIEHLARRLIDRYGPEASDEAEQIVRLLVADGNEAQAEIWTKVHEACRRMALRRNDIARRPRD